MDKLFQKLTLDDCFTTGFKMQKQRYNIKVTEARLLDSGEIRGNVLIDTEPHSPSAVCVADVAIAGKNIDVDYFKDDLLLRLATQHSLVPQIYVADSIFFNTALIDIHIHYKQQYTKIEDAIHRGGLEK